MGVFPSYLRTETDPVSETLCFLVSNRTMYEIEKHSDSELCLLGLHLDSEKVGNIFLRIVSFSLFPNYMALLYSSKTL
jgi:hypothetical protein